MRNNQDFITSPKFKNNKPNDLITIIIFEKPSNSKLKTSNFPFIKLHGKPLLEKQIEIIQSCFKNYEIIFCCGNSSKKIFEHIKKTNYRNFRIVENQIFQDSNCCESIRLALNNTFNDKVLIFPEDILLSQSVITNIELNSNCILVNQENNHSSFEIGAIHESSKLDNLTIGIKQNYWTEILFLANNKTIKEYRNILSLDEFKNKLFFESINYLSKRYDIKVIDTKQCLKLNNVKMLKRINFE